MLKKIFVLFLFFTGNVFSQNWTYQTTGNAFDGKYKIASVVGKGSEYPYTKPTLAIASGNQFILTDAGYFNGSLIVEFAFDEIAYFTSINHEVSNNGKVIIFNMFTDLEQNEYLKYKVIDYIRKSKKLEIRVTTNYSSNYIIFGLSGSTKAINYVLGESYIDNMLKSIDETKH